MRSIKSPESIPRKVSNIDIDGCENKEINMNIFNNSEFSLSKKEISNQ